MSSFDEDNDKEVFAMDMDVIPDEHYSWDAAAFGKVAMSKHFGQAKGSPVPFFATREQYCLYRGGIDTRPMYTDQQQLDWFYLKSFSYMSSLIDSLKTLGWKRTLRLHQDWNEAVIRQFYATLEVHDEEEKLLWMTGTTECRANFRDLAVAEKLNYNDMKQGTKIVDLPVLSAEEKVGYHYPEASDFGPSGGLRRLPRVMLEVLRHTVVPSIGQGAIEWPTLEIINALLNRRSINLLDWLVTQMLECKWDTNAPLVLQPYIIVLVLCTVKNFHGTYKVWHPIFRPFLIRTHYLAREPSPASRRFLRSNSPGMTELSIFHTSLYL